VAEKHIASWLERLEELAGFARERAMTGSITCQGALFLPPHPILAS
jgi:hypothetical protein